MASQAADQRQKEQVPPSSSISEALSLDLQVLVLLLRRNGAAQHRSRYYRRLVMVTKCLERYQLDDGSFFSEILSPIRAEVDWIESMVDRDRRKRARGAAEDKWTTTKRTRASHSTSSLQDDEYDKEEESNDPSSLLAKRILDLSRTVTKCIPEAISRILFAAEALYAELSRGYFVPFCSVALAAISRIRTILMRMGREGCVELGRSLCAIDIALKLVEDIGDGSGDDEQLWHGKLNLDRIASAATKIQHGNESSENAKWGEWTTMLMSEFVEMDEFQHKKDQRIRQRQGVLLRGMSDISSASAVSRSAIDASAGSNGRENGFDSDANISTSAKKTLLRNDMNEDDLGCSVDIGQNDVTVEAKTQKLEKNKTNSSIDANEKNLRLMKTKKQGKANKPSGNIANAPDHPKKKVKKRKSEASKSDSIDDILGSLGDETGSGAFVGEEKGAAASSEKSRKKKEKKKKEKKKKDKKKRKKDTLDDIFDGL